MRQHETLARTQKDLYIAVGSAAASGRDAVKEVSRNARMVRLDAAPQQSFGNPSWRRSRALWTLGDKPGRHGWVCETPFQRIPAWVARGNFNDRPHVPARRYSCTGFWLARYQWTAAHRARCLYPPGPAPARYRVQVAVPKQCSEATVQAGAVAPAILFFPILSASAVHTARQRDRLATFGHLDSPDLSSFSGPGPCPCSRYTMTTKQPSFGFVCSF